MAAPQKTAEGSRVQPGTHLLDKQLPLRLHLLLQLVAAVDAEQLLRLCGGRGVRLRALRCNRVPAASPCSVPPQLRRGLVCAGDAAPHTAPVPAAGEQRFRARGAWVQGRLGGRAAPTLSFSASVPAVVRPLEGTNGFASGSSMPNSPPFCSSSLPAGCEERRGERISSAPLALRPPEKRLEPHLGVHGGGHGVLRLHHTGKVLSRSSAGQEQVPERHQRQLWRRPRPEPDLWPACHHTDSTRERRRGGLGAFFDTTRCGS